MLSEAKNPCIPAQGKLREASPHLLLEGFSQSIIKRNTEILRVAQNDKRSIALNRSIANESMTQ